MTALPFLLFVILCASAFAQLDISDEDQSIIKLIVPTHRPTDRPQRRGSGRITNGTIVTQHSQFPYQVGLLSYNAARSAEWCGGSIISNQWILTAAHCVIGKEETKVYIGVNDRSLAAKYNVQKTDYIIHEGYNPKNHFEHDIALIKLPSPLTFSNDIKAISLDKAMTLTKWDNKDAIVSGWGAVASGAAVQKILQYADVKILPNHECKQYWKSLKPTQICQKVIDNKGICQGDSGGPLAVNENGKRVLIGLTSFTISHKDQCEMKTPRVFTRVAAYYSWVCLKTNSEVC